MAKKLLVQKQESILLSEGILLSGDFCEPRERRWTDFFVRAFFLFAIVTGSLGGMLSAFDISYDKWIFFAAALLSALYCASLYFAAWWENLGYVLIFIFILNAGFGLQTYISSGFYGILNEISTAATSFFETNAQVSYAEQIENHSLAVSVAMCYFALIGSIFTNGLIARKMRYLPVTVFSIFFLLIPIYLEQEPSAGYVILYMSGITAVYIFRQNQYQAQNVKAKAYRKAIHKEAKKHHFSGSFSGKAAVGTLLAVLLVCGLVTGLTELILPQETYLSDHTKSSLKLRTMDSMENLYLLGVAGLINFYQSTGGLSSGRLGGVNSVRLDYETDLTLEFVPYTYERIYLKSFVGTSYSPYENRWENGYAYTNPVIPPDRDFWNYATTTLLTVGYDSNLPSYARGIMTVRNVAAPVSIYAPYYTQGTLVGGKLQNALRGTAPGTEQSYVFYPLLTDHLVKNIGPLENDSLWLEVPEPNQEVIAAFCQKAGLSGSRQEIIDQIRDYFQQNFPYTLSPGITPRRKDFVNYFLEEKQKGYCAHFASSAVLILRHMGIPARYVEGYAVDAMEIAEDATLTDQNVSDYYDGPSLLAQSSVVSYDASDGNAHAWVEMYDESIGWYPVEFTPYQTEEENQDSIWDMFLRLFQTDETKDSPDRAAEGAANIAGALRSSAYGFAACLILLLIVISVVFLAKKGIWSYRYHHADRSEKLLMQYRRTIRRICQKSRWNKNLGTAFTKELASSKNFEEQVSLLAQKEILKSGTAAPEHLIQVLNEAAFSQAEIDEEAFAIAYQLLSI